IAIKTMEVDVKGTKIPAKFITKRCATKEEGLKLGKKREKRVKNLSSQIYSLLITNFANSLTSFPSILLSSFSSILEQMFQKENMTFQSYGVGSLVELFSLLQDRYNLYNYGEGDLLIAM